MNEYVHALFAYDSGWTGKGVTVASVDDGIDTANSEFAGRISPLSKDFGHSVVTNPDGTQTDSARNVLGDSYSDHGTATSGVIVANRDGKGMQGLAYDAQIAMLRVTDVDYGTKSEYFMTQNTAAAVRYAADNGIKIINRSLNSSASAPSPNDVLAQAVTYLAGKGGLIINSAGNNGQSSIPDEFMVNSTNRNSWIFVGAIDTTGTGYQISSYSNRPGVTLMDRYVVAPGDNLTLKIGGDGAIYATAGTSLAAPMVTALAALIQQKWPQLTGQQIGDVILTTAKDLGDPGTDPIYGRGLVDYKAALEPVNPKLSNGQTASSLESNAIVLPASVGSKQIASALSDVTVLDQFGRDYRASMSGRVITPEERQNVAGLVGSMANTRSANLVSMNLSGSVSYSFFGNQRPADMPNAAFNSALIEGRFGSMSFTYGYRANIGTNAPFMGLGPVSDAFAAYAPQADTQMGVGMPGLGGRVKMTVATGAGRGTKATAIGIEYRGFNGGVRLGLIDERGSVLGSYGMGSLSLGTGTRTVVIEGDRTFGIATGWSLHGYASLGYTKASVDRASVFTQVSGMVGSRFGLTVEGNVAGGTFSLGVAQPLTIESGSANMHLGSSYDLQSMSLAFTDRRVGLSGQRRVQMTTGFSRSWGDSSLRLGVAHDVNQTRATTALVGYGMNF